MSKLFSDLSALLALEKSDPLIFHLAYIKARRKHKQTQTEFKKTFEIYKAQRLAVIASLGRKEGAING
jgi:hypothetical protein